MRRAWLVPSGAVAALLMVLPAFAHHTDLDDPNDTRGLLDIRRVELAHRADPPQWTVVTGPSWTIRRIWDQGFVIVYVDTQGGERPEYYALLRSDGTRMGGRLYRDRATGRDV